MGPFATVVLPAAISALASGISSWAQGKSQERQNAISTALQRQQMMAQQQQAAMQQAEDVENTRYATRYSDIQKQRMNAALVNAVMNGMMISPPRWLAAPSAKSIRKTATELNPQAMNYQPEATPRESGLGQALGVLGGVVGAAGSAYMWNQMLNGQGGGKTGSISGGSKPATPTVSTGFQMPNLQLPQLLGGQPVQVGLNGLPPWRSR